MAPSCGSKNDNRGLDVMNHAASAVTSMKNTVNAAIESRYGRMKTWLLMPIRSPPVAKPAKRRICLCRDAPTIETAVKKQVSMIGTPVPGQSMELENITRAYRKAAFEREPEV